MSTVKKQRRSGRVDSERSRRKKKNVGKNIFDTDSDILVHGGSYHQYHPRNTVSDDPNIEQEMVSQSESLSGTNVLRT